MRKLLLNLFLSTVGLLFAGQASAQEEIAPGSKSLWRTTNKYTVSDFNSKLSVSVACASAR